MIRAAATAGILGVLLLATLSLREIAYLRGDIQTMTEKADASSGSDEKSVSWEDADCFTRTVKTVRKPDESMKDFCARHDAAVAHDLQIYGVKKTEDSVKFIWLKWYLRARPAEIVPDTPHR